MKHPDVFGKVTAFSPFIWTPELFEATADFLYAENPDGLTGPDPYKFFTSAMYGFAAAWSPNLDNPPYYVDLPFVFETGQPVPSVIAKWEAQNLFSLLPQYRSSLTGLSSLYFDCGDKDELSTNLTNQAFHEALGAANVPHTFDLYDGTHLDHVYARLENALRFLSQGD
jgi:S-formylglutathione hydrolase FrmB